MASPTLTPQPTSTPPAISPTTPTEQPKPDDIEGIAPLNIHNPQEVLASISPEERSCLEAEGIDARQIERIFLSEESTETAAKIIDCFQDETVLRVVVTSLIGQTEPFGPTTSTCIRDVLAPIDLRGLLSSSGDTVSSANAMAISMAAFTVSLSCMEDDEWELYAPGLSMGEDDRRQMVCFLREIGGAEKLVEAVRDANLGDTTDEFIRALSTCDPEAESLDSSPSPTPTPEPTPNPTTKLDPDPTPTPVPPTATATSAPSPTSTTIPTQVAISYAPQPHIMLRVVLVTEDWMPFSDLGGWTNAVSQRESASLRFYEAAIWEEIDAVHLYAFTNEFDPFFGTGGSATPAEIIANREKYAIKKVAGLPEWQTKERSVFLRKTFEEFADILVKHHPNAQHHLMFSGHGGPSGDLFASQLGNADADAFLGTWARLLGRKLGVIDMGGPCNKGSYVDMANFCKHARYYVASDLPNGGFSMDDWNVEKYYETDAETQYHRILAEGATLEDALKNRIELRRTRYEYSRNNMTQNRVQQSSYVYSCPAFADFRQAFETFIKENDVAYPQWDLYDTMVTYDAPTALLEKFNKIIAHSVDNRDFFEWTFRANGIISPLDLFYNIHR